MQVRNDDLHGMVPDQSDAALLLIDVINDLEFPGSDELMQFVLPMATRIAALKQRAIAARIPVVYVNDNFGRWQSDFRKSVEHVLNGTTASGVAFRGRPMAELLPPGDNDYFVLKPKHSGFFSTSLDILLDYLHVNTLILAGVAGNICVLFTANDAYMRDLRIFVPCDCTASNSKSANDNALSVMHDVLKADITPSTELDLKSLLRQAAAPGEPDVESPNQDG